MIKGNEILVAEVVNNTTNRGHIRSGFHDGGDDDFQAQLENF